jgi:methylmalonyl-CoA mutase N-terminal domain/subunit
VDVLGGSYYLENMTFQFEKHCMALIEQIDELGGAAAAVEKGFYERLINRGAYEYQKAWESNERVKVGVNKFQTEKEPKFKAFKGNPEEEEKQVARLKELKRRRDNRTVRKTLRNLYVKAKADNNLVLPVLEAVRNYATVGEVCDTLRDLWGDWKAHPSLMM